MAAINGLGLSFATTTVTYNAGAVDDVRVDAGSEVFTLAAAGKFKKSLLVVDSGTGAVTEVTGTDADTLVAAVAPAVPADKIVVAVVEVDDTGVTGLDLTAAGDTTAASA